MHILGDKLEEMAPPDASSPPVLFALGGLLGQEVQLDDFLQMVVDRVARSMEADRGTLYLLDGAQGVLFSRAAHLPELSQIRLKVGQGVAGHVAATGRPVNVPDPGGEQRFFADIDKLTGYRTSSLLAVPLRDGQGELRGVLQVLNRLGGGRFTEEDLARLEAMAQQVSSALERTSLYAELRRAVAQPQAPVGYCFNRIIGESAPMRAAYALVQRAARTLATVLIRGESGCGKELFARAVHVNSPRRDRPFIKVDCASLPAQLIENELFGHEKGAYTGADQRGAGRFEAADGGTVFIDELGELPLEVQGKLLRVLQDRELERVGGTQTVRVDVRIVCATNRDLERMVREGRFREDLYYRVKVVELLLPPLRERGAEDIERLAHHFVGAAAARHRREPVPRLLPDALQRLRAHHWPGNVRELEHCMESAVVLCDGDALGAEHLPLPARAKGGPGSAATALDGRPGIPRAAPAEGEGDITPLAEVERRHILDALQRLGGNRTAAAKALGIGRNTLGRKLKEYGLGDDGG